LNTPGNCTPHAATEINFGLHSAGRGRLVRHDRPGQGSTYLRTAINRVEPAQAGFASQRFSVPGSQFSVLGSQSPVLSSRFLVPGSWFSVLGSWFNREGTIAQQDKRCIEIHIAGRYTQSGLLLSLTSGFLAWSLQSQPAHPASGQWQAMLPPACIPRTPAHLSCLSYVGARSDSAIFQRHRATTVDQFGCY
jgi:hypothetical protein